MKELRMRDALARPARRPWWLVAMEIPMWLGAALLLLAQIACQSSAGPIGFSPETMHLKDVSFTFDFVARKASKPALVRYWVASNQTVTVNWKELYVGTECNLCQRSHCERELRLPTVPLVSVRHRPNMDAKYLENAQFEMLTGCVEGPEGGPATFSPTETGEHLAFLFLPTGQMSPPDAAYIPSEPATSVTINVISNRFTMPPRYMTKVDDNTWEWRSREGADGMVKEAFDPRLHVGKVVVLIGTCTLRGPDIPDDECGTDAVLNEAFKQTRKIAPHYVRFGDKQCRGLQVPSGDGDGDIDLSPDPSDPMKSLCRPQFHVIAVTPNYVSAESNANERLLWRVEFSAMDGFPPPNPDEEVWIEFTLVPAP